MDEKDKKIIEELRQDSSLTVRQIAKKTLIPITTVHKRIKKLRAEGIIRKYSVELDFSKLGRSLAAIILASVSFEALERHKLTHREFSKKLNCFENVEKVFHVTGQADYAIVIRVRDTAALEEFLYNLKKRFDAIERTQTLVVLSEV